MFGEPHVQVRPETLFISQHVLAIRQRICPTALHDDAEQGILWYIVNTVDLCL